MFGVGIFGAGRVSGGHAHAVTNVEGLRLVAVAEPDAERRNRFTERFPCEGYANHIELLARQDIHLILAGLPHWLHAPMVLDALNAGKHVLVEKPMACTLEECDAMISAASANGVSLMTGHHHRFVGENIAAKEVILSGELGEIVLATETWHKPFGLATRPPWFLDRTKGGGMWLMNAAHMIDRLLWFVESEVVAVKGLVSNRIMKQKADDSAAAMIQFANDVYATIIHSGYAAPKGEEWHVGEITLTKGMVKTVPGQSAWVARDGKYEQIPVRRTSAMRDELAGFVQSIQNGTEPPVSNAHARAVVETMLAVEESSRTRREVRLR